MNSLLTVREVAELVQCSSKTVMRAIRTGELRAAQLAARGVWRVRPDDVEAWVEARTQPPAPPSVVPVLPLPAGGVVRPLRAGHGAGGMLRVTSDMGRKTA